jgi:hypothetical protein
MRMPPQVSCDKHSARISAFSLHIAADIDLMRVTVLKRNSSSSFLLISRNASANAH